jgi:microcystin-dependent protein
MSDQCMGEIRMFGGNYAPEDWALCDGSLLQVADYQALYSLLGTAFGGDGVHTFGLPDLRGRIPISQGKAPSGTTYALGGKGGASSVVLGVDQIPAHTHTMMANPAAATAGSPANALLAQSVNSNGSPNQDIHYLQAGVSGSKDFTLNPDAVLPEGSNAAHENRMSYLCVNFIIAIVGVYPSFQ